MSWVLILNSQISAKPPAVIGGYPTREEAERAGYEATTFSGRDLPYYVRFLTIPGAALQGPSGFTESRVFRSGGYPDDKIERHTRRLPPGDVACQCSFCAVGRT